MVYTFIIRLTVLIFPQNFIFMEISLTGIAAVYFK